MDAATNGAGQPALIQPTLSTTGARMRGVAAGAAPTHIQHHGRSHACACHQRCSNPHPAPRAFACAGLRRARPNPGPAPRAFVPRSIRLIGWHYLHRRASTHESRAGAEPRSARVPPNGWAFSGRRCRRVWSALTVFSACSCQNRRDLAAPLERRVGRARLLERRRRHAPAALRVRQPTALGNWRPSNPHPAPRAFACAGLRPGLIQPTLSTTSARMRARATSAAPIQAQHHEYSPARGCGERGPTHTQHHGRSYHARFG